MDFGELNDIGSRKDGRRTSKDWAVFPDGSIRYVLVGPGGTLRRTKNGVRPPVHLAQSVKDPDGNQTPLYLSLREAYQLDEREQIQADGYATYREWFMAGRKSPKGLRKPGGGSSFPEEWLPEIVVRRRGWAAKNREVAGYKPPEPPSPTGARKAAKRGKQPQGKLERIADVD